MKVTEKAVKIGLSFLMKQAFLVVRLKDLLAQMVGETDNACVPVLSFMVSGIYDSCGTLWHLVPNGRFRDAFVTGRTIFLTVLNACFICAQGKRSAERALRHAKQKAYRDMNRELRINDLSVVLACSDRAPINADLDAAIREFTDRRGQEVKQWTPESVNRQIEIIENKYGKRVGALLILAMLSTYRHASEIAHGTLFGTLWTYGLTESAPTSTAELTEGRVNLWNSALYALLYTLNTAIMCLFEITSKEFPAICDLAKESQALVHEMNDTLIAEGELRP